MARELTERGYKDVRVLRGGFKAWQNAALPTQATEGSGKRPRK